MTSNGHLLKGSVLTTIGHTTVQIHNSHQGSTNVVGTFTIYPTTTQRWPPSPHPLKHKALLDPECDTATWWLYATCCPHHAMASPLFGILTLEDPARWQEIVRQLLRPWIRSYLQEFDFERQWRFATEALDLSIPFQKQLRTGIVEKTRKIVALRKKQSCFLDIREYLLLVEQQKITGVEATVYRFLLETNPDEIVSSITDDLDSQTSKDLSAAERGEIQQAYNWSLWLHLRQHYLQEIAP